MMLTGHSHHTLDEKWRLIIPSKYRISLGERFYLSRSTESDDCFWIMPEKEFEKLIAIIKDRIKNDPNDKIWFKNFIASAQDCEEEKQGRVLIPANLREIIGIDETKVTLVGNINRLEVYSTSKWEAMQIKDYGEACKIVNNKYDFGI